MEKYMERDPVLYYSKSKSFNNFLSWTDEKTKIAEEIIKIVGKKRNHLLDIGAGDGTIDKKIEGLFYQIVLVEPGPKLFQVLKKKFNKAKYTLINLPFEQAGLSGKFDVILASHALKFIPNPLKELMRIKDLLKDDGLLLVIDHQRGSDFHKFYNRYRKNILGKNSANPAHIDYLKILSKFFKVKERIFKATLSIPSVDNAISLFDFIYDVDLKKVSRYELSKIKNGLKADYGQGPVNIIQQQSMFVCTKL